MLEQNFAKTTDIGKPDRSASGFQFPMKYPNLSEEKLFELRNIITKRGSASQTKTAYQDAVLFFIRSNAFRGDNVVEVGCYKGGLTVQYAYLCQQLGKKLHVIDYDKELLEETKKLVYELGYGNVASFYNMDYESFVSSESFPQNTIATIIDADHSYAGCLKDCNTLKKVLPSMYGVIFHDFTLRYTTWDGVGVDKAIYEVFGQHVRLYPIGFQSVCSETPTPEGAYLESNEGVIMVVPWQPADVFAQKEPPSKLRQWLVRTPILGPLLAKCCNMTDK